MIIGAQRADDEEGGGGLGIVRRGVKYEHIEMRRYQPGQVRARPYSCKRTFAEFEVSQ